MGWLYDEDIGRSTIEEFEKVGIKGKHVKYDLQYEGRDDLDIIPIAKKHQATIITNNVSDYIAIPNHNYHNTFGVWGIVTKEPKRQATLMKKAIAATGLKTKSQRKEKKVVVGKTSAEVTDARSNRITQYPYAKASKIGKSRGNKG